MNWVGLWNFCIHISDLLEILKPNDLDEWKLKSNYEYYTNKKATQTTKTLVLKNNDLVPNWYFQKEYKKEQRS